jgi:hypothetical protein
VILFNNCSGSEFEVSKNFQGELASGAAAPTVTPTITPTRTPTPTVTLGSPLISSTGGAFERGNQVSISGSDFGSRDNFNSGGYQLRPWLNVIIAAAFLSGWTESFSGQETIGFLQISLGRVELLTLAIC